MKSGVYGSGFPYDLSIPLRKGAQRAFTLTSVKMLTHSAVISFFFKDAKVAHLVRTINSLLRWVPCCMAPVQVASLTDSWWPKTCHHDCPSEMKMPSTIDPSLRLRGLIPASPASPGWVSTTHINSYTVIFNTNMDNIERRYSSNMENIERRYSSNMDNIERRYSSNMDNIERRYSSNMDNIERRYSSNMDNIERRYSSNMDNIERQYSSNMDNIEHNIVQIWSKLYL